MVHEVKSHLQPRVALGVAAVAAGYAIVNGLWVFVPFVPGLAAFIAWGFVLPFLFLCGSWVAVARQRGMMQAWWVVGLAATGTYAAMGFFSAYIIAAMWAAV